MPVENITLYTSKACPFSHRVELALAEAKANFKRYEIDLGNKPDWYTPKVNSAKKVPAIAYGGPDVAADQPSPESIKITESIILTEFVADLFPQAHLLPSDPVLRAKARFFYDAIGTKFYNAFVGYLAKGSVSQEELLKVFEELQALLAPTGYVVGEWSIADASWTGFVARLFVALENDLGAYPAGEGPETLHKLLTDSRFARFQKYWKDVTSRESFTSTFDKEVVRAGQVKSLGGIPHAQK